MVDDDDMKKSHDWDNVMHHQIKSTILQKRMDNFAGHSIESNV